MAKNNDEHTTYGYDSFSADELKDSVIRLLKERTALQAEKKDYVKSISDSLKDIEERLDIIVYWIGVKETEAAKAKLVEDAQKVMEE